MDINDEAVRVGQQEGRVVGDVRNFENDARISRLILRDADLLQKAVMHIEALADQD